MVFGRYLIVGYLNPYGYALQACPLQNPPSTAGFPETRVPNDTVLAIRTRRRGVSAEKRQLLYPWWTVAVARALCPPNFELALVSTFME